MRAIAVAFALAVLPAALLAQADTGALSAQRAQERDALFKFCTQTDLSAPATVAGAQDRTDCWKRMQLEGMSDPVVDAKYQAAIRDLDQARSRDSLQKEKDSSTAAVDQRMQAAQRAIQARNLDDAESTVNDILTIQPNNQRALAYRDRILALKRARQLKITLFAVGAALLVIAAGVGVVAKKLLAKKRQRDQVAEKSAAERKSLLKIVDGLGRGKTFAVEGDLFRIGAAASDKPEEKNDLVLSDSAATVSRFHCALIRRGRQWYIIDSSLNGTKVNGERLARGEDYELDDGDEFTIADAAKFKFLAM